MKLNVIVAEKEGGVFTIAPVGPIDSNTYAVLNEKVNSVLAKSPKVIIFDMAGVTYISSAGISVILRAKKGLKQSSGMLTIVNLRPKVKRVFDIIKALPDQQVFASVEEMDAYLDKIQKQL